MQSVSHLLRVFFCIINVTRVVAHQESKTGAMGFNITRRLELKSLEILKI